MWLGPGYRVMRVQMFLLKRGSGLFLELRFSLHHILQCMLVLLYLYYIIEFYKYSTTKLSRLMTVVTVQSVVSII